MEQAEILSLIERLIPVYRSDDFNLVLSQMTEREHPSVKILVKMEMKLVMAPCTKTIDLRGRVQGECREYKLDGLTHWLDDVAINAYHKKVKRYGAYTEGVWEALINTRNNFRVMSKNRPNMTYSYSITDPDSPYEAEAIHLGYDLRRQENRIRMSSQADIHLKSGQERHGVSVDLSSSEAKFKVPSAFDYKLGEVSDAQTSHDYLLNEKPSIPSSELNRFRHSRQVMGAPGIYFDSSSRRSEPRFMFDSPVELAIGTKDPIKGSTVDFSSRGLNVKLSAPLQAKAGDEICVNFIELQRYDSDVPLSDVPYTVIKLSPDCKNVHLSIIENAQTTRCLNFLKRLINHNQGKLIEDNEPIPSSELLSTMHHLLLGRMVSVPFYIEKKDRILQPRAIGVNFPLDELTKIFQSLGHGGKFSMEPIFKNRTNTLLAKPMRPIEGAEPTFYELYIAVVQKGNQIEEIHTRLLSDFESIKERIRFVKKAKSVGAFYVIRISGMPVFDSLTNLLNEELSSLAKATIHHAKDLEKEFTSLIGYGEFTDITEEILIRLELT
jgi:hypothetical protein